GRGTQGSPGGQVSAGAYSGWQELTGEETAGEETAEDATVEAGAVVRGTDGLELLEERSCSGLRHLLPMEIRPEQQGRGTQGSPGGQVSAGAYSGWQELAAEEEETIEEVVDTTTVEEVMLEVGMGTDEWILEDEWIL
ncbi:hypothetical protein LTS18_007596, partial [Coniosporium uncinatum]